MTNAAPPDYRPLGSFLEVSGTRVIRTPLLACLGFVFLGAILVVVFVNLG